MPYMILSNIILYNIVIIFSSQTSMIRSNNVIMYLQRDFLPREILLPSQVNNIIQRKLSLIRSRMCYKPLLSQDQDDLSPYKVYRSGGTYNALSRKYDKIINPTEAKLPF